MVSFKKLIQNGQDFIRNIDVINRDYLFYEDIWNLNKIVSFVGPRRVGKTYLMMSFIKQLIEEKKIELEQVVFLDFSLNVGENIDFMTLIEDYKTLFPDKKPVFIFDEVQDIANMRQLVLGLFNWQYKLFISGSNSSLLSSELSTHFRGRIYEYRGFPLTFSEILRFKQIKEKEFYSSEELGIIKNTLNNILIYGNFPEIVLNKDNNIVKINNLKTYFDILLYKDLLEKYKIDNEPALKYFLKNITKSYTKTLNINKIYNELKSQQITIGKNTLYQYWEYIKSVFFAYELENFYNPKSLKKGYLYNLGFNKLLSDKENLGQSFENFVLLELLKKYDKVYFKKNGKEIDFYIEEKNLNIQVCYELNIENLDREIKPLLKQDGEKILVYFEKDDNLKIDKNVKLVSFEKIEKSV